MSADYPDRVSGALRARRVKAMAQPAAVERFAELIRIPTISIPDESAPDIDWTPFERFLATFERLYPGLHSVLTRETVAGHTLLYRWRGATDVDPIVLMAHYDVVPASAAGWTHPPFSATITGEGEDAVIWGRGTLDDKGALVAIAEAVENALAAGVTPPRDIYLSFGHNEETYGGGATAVVELLRARGVRPGLVLDEGGAVVEGVFPTVDVPVAVIGVSEKGVTNVRLRVAEAGGHASMPPRMTATVRLARAITRVHAKPFPARLTEVNREMLGEIAPHARGAIRLALSNLWLTAPLVRRVLGRLGDETRAMVATSVAVTELSGSAAANVLAESASAMVNMRVAVGSTVAESVEHLRRAIDDPLVGVEVERPSEPSPVSPRSGPAWELLRSAIEAAHPGTVVTPYVMLAASDSRFFTAISDHVYRFSPFAMSREERATLHAIDERMHVATWLRGIAFYERIIAG
jgi:carboxypeptidase PM20D1